MNDVYINGIGLLFPGLEDWLVGGLCLAGTREFEYKKPVIPRTPTLPPNERRRCGQIVHLALNTAHKAVGVSDHEASQLHTVFACSDGDIELADLICLDLSKQPATVSPTRFHNSVHNTPAAYWSIASKNQLPSTSLSGASGSFAAGLLESMLQVELESAAVLFLAYDFPLPPRMRPFNPISEACAIALVITQTQTEATVAKIGLEEFRDSTETVLEDENLEKLRHTSPAARGLTLLSALARRKSEIVVLPHNGNVGLTLNIEPCN